jgi:hypothetical protein
MREAIRGWHSSQYKNGYTRQSYVLKYVLKAPSKGNQRARLSRSCLTGRYPIRVTSPSHAVRACAAVTQWRSVL